MTTKARASSFAQKYRIIMVKQRKSMVLTKRERLEIVLARSRTRNSSWQLLSGSFDPKLTDRSAQDQNLLKRRYRQLCVRWAKQDLITLIRSQLITFVGAMLIVATTVLGVLLAHPGTKATYVWFAIYLASAVWVIIAFFSVAVSSNFTKRVGVTSLEGHSEVIPRLCRSPAW